MGTMSCAICVDNECFCLLDLAGAERVQALRCIEQKGRYAEMINDLCKHSAVRLSILLGLSSAVVDNVPLVELESRAMVEVDWRKGLALLLFLVQCFLVFKLLRWCRNFVRGCACSHSWNWASFSKWYQHYMRQEERVVKAKVTLQIGVFIIGCYVLPCTYCLRMVTFQARACGVLPSWDEMDETPFPTVDLFVALMWMSCILIISNKHLVTPRSLDVCCFFFYIATLLGLLLTPVQTFEVYRQVMFRLIFCRVLPDVTTKRAAMFVVFNVLGVVVVIARVIAVRERGRNQLDEALVLNLAPVFGAVLVRQALYAIAENGVNLQTLTVERNAISSLLLGLCDAVVEVDENLKLTQDGRQLSTMLLHCRGVAAQQLAGSDLLAFFHPDDRAHVQQSLCGSPDDTQTRVFNARMLDGLSNHVEVELFHINMENQEGQKCYLVGMREFQDLGFVAPLPAREPSNPTGKRTGDFSFVFCASSARVLTAGKEVDRMLLSNGVDAEELREMTVFDLLYGLDPAWNAYLKEKVTEHGSGLFQPQLYELGLLHLLGTVPVQANLVLRQDGESGALVGLVRLIPSRSFLDSETPSSKTSGSQCGSISDLHRSIPL
ncbi:unnamed protein product [Symbiodinium sp. KB8]|nr:unnamed protein product [Symbiodinium sp. KB8]